MNLPKISIITPSYNQGQYIEETICSVLEQNYPNLEYVVIDGASNDQSVEIIRKYQKHLKYWISEKDDGQADAINKGLRHCEGDIFNWINSDDILFPSALHLIGEMYTDNVDAIAGQVEQFNETIKTRYIKENKNISAETLILNPSHTCFHQPGLWLNLKKMKSIGEFRRDMHYCFDQEFYIRYFHMFPNIYYLEDTLVKFRLHEHSKTIAFNEEFFKEQYQILDEIVIGKISLLHSQRKIAKEHLAWLDWKAQLKMASQNKSASALFGLIIEMLKNPRRRINRYSLGMLRKILLHP